MDKKTYNQEYYAANKERVLAKNRAYAERNKEKVRAQKNRWLKRRRAETKTRLNEIKASTPCEDCGLTYHPVAMDFHHVNGDDKIKNVSLLAQYRWEKVEEEIAKCILLCSNCHRIRTWA